VITTLLIIVVLLVAGLLIYAATRPDSFQVQRSATIQAPAERIHPMIDDFRRWPEWSPWEHRDPAMQRTLGGAARGKGATYHWLGNKEVGEGRMEVLDSTAPREVRIKLDFIKPFEGHNTTVFALEPDGAATRVVWTMSGPSPFMMKVMGIFMNMDRMIGRDFEAGLTKMKAMAEKATS